MRLFDVLLSVGYFAALLVVYLFRYSFGESVFEIVFVGLLLLGALYLGKRLLPSQHVKTDERTQMVSGTAAKVALVATFAAATLGIVYLEITNRPTSPTGAVALLMALMGVVYSVTYAYLETR